jgi:hypothetical protein
MDLLLPPPAKNAKGQVEVPKLEIKKDSKGMVVVQGATVVEVGVWVCAPLCKYCVALAASLRQQCLFAWKCVTLDYGCLVLTRL